MWRRRPPVRSCGLPAPACSGCMMSQAAGMRFAVADAMNRVLNCGRRSATHDPTHRAERDEPVKHYTIYMKNCAFFARHGFFDEVAFLGQRFFVGRPAGCRGGRAASGRQAGRHRRLRRGLQGDRSGRAGLQRRYLIEAWRPIIATGLTEKFPHIKRAEITGAMPNARSRACSTMSK